MSRHTLVGEVAALACPAVVHGLAITIVLFTDRLIFERYGADALGSEQISRP